MCQKLGDLKWTLILSQLWRLESEIKVLAGPHSLPRLQGRSSLASSNFWGLSCPLACGSIAPVTPCTITWPLLPMSPHTPPSVCVSSLVLRTPVVKGQPIPVLLPGKFHGLSSLVGYSPWGRRVGHDWATSLSLSACIDLISIFICSHGMLVLKGTNLSSYRWGNWGPES